MDLAEVLELQRKYPNLSKVSFNYNTGQVDFVEFTCGGSLKPKVVAQDPKVLMNEMPPDDIMLFASTPTFEDMIDESKRGEG